MTDEGVIGFGYIRCGSCEQRWEAIATEWPPKVLVCPVCTEVSTLITKVDSSLGYKSRGPHRAEAQ